MAAESTAAIRTLQQTPTWAVAIVCLVIISISILIEQIIHLIAKWLKGHKKTALYDAVDKLRSVLMFLGFMSLILTVAQNPISKICISNKLGNEMLPCHRRKIIKNSKEIGYDDPFFIHQRILAADSDASGYCESKGLTPLISTDGANQLSIFLFALAAMQIVYSVLTMALGRAKMRRWKGWEKETRTIEYQAANDPNRFRFLRQTTFARRHVHSWAEASIFLWIKCFFQQFFNSVAKVDYLTLRHGFISAHFSDPANTMFNFQKYIQKSLEDDFKVVVGISPFMWLLVVIFLLLDVHGWNVYLWVSFLPLTIVLVLGTKLQMIVARMAHQLNDQHSVIKGAPVVKPNDDFFWFSHPKFVLTLLHYTLFMWQYGISSCYHEHTEIIVIRVALAVTVQVMCSYITLPLYALVTQMGSNFKSAVLEEQTAKAIKDWHAGVKQKRKKQGGSSHAAAINGNDNSISNRSIISPDLSSHHPTPTLPGTTTHEIVEENNNTIFTSNTEIIQVQDHPGPSIINNSTVIHIEMSSMGKSLPNNNKQ